MKFFAYTKERGFTMKNIIKKSITSIIIMALALTLAMPMSAEAAKKKAPKISKTKVTMTITKKKTKPAVQLKVKNAAGRKVKWTTSNKKVVTVSKKGKVVAKKKGVAMITVKVKGSKTLRCKVTVKDNRKAVTKKPITNPEPSPAPKPDGETECQHNWVEKTVTEIVCECGEVFPDDNARILHNRQFIMQGLEGHSFSTNEQTYYECSKCHKTK